MDRLAEDIQKTLFVQHLRNRMVFWVSGIDPTSGFVILEDANRTETQVGRTLFENNYHHLQEDGLKVQTYLDPEFVSTLAHQAPLKLLYAVLRDRGQTEPPAVEKDFKAILEKAIGNFKWADWWTRVQQLANENPSSIQSGGASKTARWSLSSSPQSPPEVPLPESEAKPTPKRRPERVILPLSVNVTSVLCGDITFKDLSEAERRNVTRRLISDGIWWWFSKQDNITQVIQSDPPLTELLKHIAQPDCPPERFGLFVDIIPKLTSAGAAYKRLGKTLESLDKVLETLDDSSSDFAALTQKLLPVLLQVSLRIRNDEDRNQTDALAVEAAIGNLLNRRPQCGDGITTYFENYAKLPPELKEIVHLGQLDPVKTQVLADVVLDESMVDELVQELVVRGSMEQRQSERIVDGSNKRTTKPEHVYQETISTLVSSVLSILEDEPRTVLTLKLVASIATRKGVLNFLIKAQANEDTSSFLLSCMRRASVDSDLASLRGISAVASEFCHNIDDSYSEQIVALWMGITSAGVQVAKSLEDKMRSQINEQLADPAKPSALSSNQALQLFGQEAKKRLRAADNRAQRELLKSQKVHEDQLGKIEGLESELVSVNRMVDRLRSTYGISEEQAKFYGKTEILVPLAGCLQDLILAQNNPSNPENRPSNAAIKINDILKIAGVRQFQNIGERLDEYVPSLHRPAPTSPTFDLPVTIVCPGFVMDNPEGGSAVILQRAYFVSSR